MQAVFAYELRKIAFNVIDLIMFSRATHVGCHVIVPMMMFLFSGHKST